MRRFLAASLLLVSLTAVPVGAAPACAYDAGTATVTVLSAEDVVLARAGDAITVNGTPCDVATVLNTDTIDLGAALLTIDLSGGPFAPGATDEGDGSSEIEITADIAELSVLGSSGNDHVVFGEDGSHPTFHWSVNLNGSEAIRDADVVLDNDAVPASNTALVKGLAGTDVLSAAGEGMADSWGGHLTMRGGPGADTLRTGQGNDRMLGGYGTDTFDASSSVGDMFFFLGHPEHAPINRIEGGASGIDTVGGIERFIGSDIGQNHFWGSDRGETFIGGTDVDDFHPGGGDDVMDGGPDPNSPNFLYFDDAPRGIEMDLRDGTAQGDGRDRFVNMHVFEMTPFGDVVFGGRENVIVVLGKGGDVYRAGWGPDSLYGGRGNDFLDGGPGVDSLHGGSGTDHCRPDPQDTFDGCELDWVGP